MKKDMTNEEKIHVLEKISKLTYMMDELRAIRHELCQCCIDMTWQEIAPYDMMESIKRCRRQNMSLSLVAARDIVKEYLKANPDKIPTDIYVPMIKTADYMPVTKGMSIWEIPTISEIEANVKKKRCVTVEIRPGDISTSWASTEEEANRVGMEYYESAKVLDKYLHRSSTRSHSEEDDT